MLYPNTFALILRIFSLTSISASPSSPSVAPVLVILVTQLQQHEVGGRGQATQEGADAQDDGQGLGGREGVGRVEHKEEQAGLEDMTSLDRLDSWAVDKNCGYMQYVQFSTMICTASKKNSELVKPTSDD